MFEFSDRFLVFETRCGQRSSKLGQLRTWARGCRTGAIRVHGHSCRCARYKRNRFAQTTGDLRDALFDSDDDLGRAVRIARNDDEGEHRAADADGGGRRMNLIGVFGELSGNEAKHPGGRG